jgi:hypothetical protein
MGRRQNTGTMVRAISNGIDDPLKAELLKLATEGKTTVTVLAYVARFPSDQQREMFEVLNELGSRGAKRYVECLTCPPSESDMAMRIIRWVGREFPSIASQQTAEALRLAALALEQEPDEADGQEGPGRQYRIPGSEGSSPEGSAEGLPIPCPDDLDI